MTEQADSLDDVLVVERGVVHRWWCDRLGRRGVGWRKDMAGLDDRACPSCQPDLT